MAMGSRALIMKCVLSLCIKVSRAIMACPPLIRLRPWIALKIFILYSEVLCILSDLCTVYRALCDSKELPGGMLCACLHGPYLSENVLGG